MWHKILRAVKEAVVKTKGKPPLTSDGLGKRGTLLTRLNNFSLRSNLVKGTLFNNSITPIA
jgi:hypothetical protein